jgi:glycosyltransferase involved in cell wall biosynthesis
MRVGIQGRDYVVSRNIADLVKGVDYVRVHDICEVTRKAYRAAAVVTDLFNDRRQDLRAGFLDFDINRVDVLHFFNVVSLGNTPWVSTFETVLPRYRTTLTCHHGRHPGFAPLKADPKVRRALDAMSRPACRNIIAISDCSARMQREMLCLYPEYREAIENKMVVLHPPQAAFFGDYHSKRLPQDGPIRFMFVGGSFFRKGGAGMLVALQQLRKDGLDVALTIVSSLAIDDYAAKETAADVANARKVIDDNREWISHYHSLPNDRVLDLMKASHVGLLPTYADTYGYSVLEFQACGCPVITTDVRALPEINDETTGWIIKLPKNEMGEAIYTSDEDRSEIANAIVSGIVAVVPDIVQNRSDIQLKADVALQRIRVEHSPERHAERLRAIYQGAAIDKRRLTGNA